MRNKHVTFKLLGLLAVLSLVAAACGDDADDTGVGGEGDGTSTTEGESSGAVGASVDGVLKFGAILPQTGSLSAFGPGMQAAVDLAAADINAAGGVLGQDIQLTSADSGTNADVANTAVERLLGSEQVDGIIGAASSSVTLLGVIAPTVGAGRVECSGSTTSPEIGAFEDDGLFFRTAPSDIFQGQLLADTIAADGASSVAIANRADDYGQAFADETTEALAAAGAEVVAQVAFDPNGTNFDADVEQIASAQPDAIVVIAFPDEGAQFLNTMIEQNVGPAQVPLYVTDGLADATVPTAVAPENASILDGTKGTRPSIQTSSDFAERLGVEQTTFAPQFYDCVILLALGAVAADTDDPEAIAAEVVELSRGGTPCSTFEECATLLGEGEDIDYEGIVSFDLSDEGEPDQGDYDLFEFSGGQISVLDTVTITAEEE
ncbi:MAG TPA: ABC transporter substrate-binding protein [Acidimicrobiales bacterium]|nr:ABC transporter substrate-binding protein [Acidimicrobiales bacterium]